MAAFHATPFSKIQASWWKTNTIWSHLKEDSNEQNKLTSENNQIHGNMRQTDSCRGRGNGGKKRKGLVKEHVWMTHGHGQRCGDGLWEQAGGLDRGGQRGKNWDTCNRTNKSKKRKKRNISAEKPDHWASRGQRVTLVEVSGEAQSIINLTN